MRKRWRGGMTGRIQEPKVKQGSTGTEVFVCLVQLLLFQFCFKDSLAFPSHIPACSCHPPLCCLASAGMGFPLESCSQYPSKACGSLAVCDLGSLTFLKAWLDGAARIGRFVSLELKGSYCALKRPFTNAQDPGSSWRTQTSVSR